MSALMKMFGRGGSNSGSASTPTNVPDSLRSKDTVEFVLALGRGPFQGLVNGQKSYYVGDTQLQNDAGTYNFTPFSLRVFRGSAEGETITPLLGGSASSTGVGVILFQNTGVVRQTVIRGFDQVNIRLEITSLFRMDGNDTLKDFLSWRIEYKATQSNTWINPFNQDITIEGKTTSPYVKEIAFGVPNITTDDYEIRVTKLSTEDSLNNRDAHDISWESFQVVKLGPLLFPGVAAVQGIAEASNNFSSLPDFSGIFYTKIIKVPSNYDPVGRTYSGTWDGTWKMAYSDNAALVFYDYITDTEGGYAAYVDLALDKYDIYDAAQWCDVLIKKDPSDPNEVGKPRYTCNLTVSDARSGKELATYMAGVFNAVFYDDLDGGARLIMDKDDPAIHLIGKADIVGEFNYSFTDVNTRYNDITVTFINPDLNWQEDRRRVFNQADIDLNGRVPLDFVAVGCIDPDEAVRRGTYKLLTALTEKQSLSITRNRMAEYMQPFDIALIADENMGYGVSGRMRALADEGLSISLRDSIFLENGISYVIRFQVPNPDYLVDGTTTGADPFTVIYRNIVNTTRGAVHTLQFDTAIASLPEYASFSLEQAGGGLGLPKPFRVLTIEDGKDSETYTVSLIEMNRNKTSGADGYSTGAEPIYTYKNPDLSPPTNLVLDEVVYYINGLPASFINGSFMLSKTNLGNVVDADGNPVVSLSDNHAVVTYLVTYVTPAGNLVSMAPTIQNEFEIKPVVQGTYTVNVQGLAVDGRASAPLTGTIVCQGKTALPSTPQNLRASGGWQEIDLAWDDVPDTDNNGYFIYESPSNIFANATRIDHAASPWYPRKNLTTGVGLFHWVTATDFVGNESPPSNSAFAVTSFIYPAALMGKKVIDDSLLVPALQIPISHIEAIALSLTDAMAHTGAVLASVNTEIIQRTTDTGSLAAQILTVQSSFGDALAAVQDTVSAATSAAGAVAIQQSILNAAFLDNKALVEDTLTAQATATGAISTRLTQFQATTGTNFAAVTQAISAATTATSALASQVDTVQTTLDNTTSLAEETLASINGIKADWTVKTEVDANGVIYIAGIGLITDASGKVPTSEFAVTVDKFIVAHLNSDGTIDKVSPFFIGPDPYYTGTGTAPVIVLTQVQYTGLLSAANITSGEMTTATLTVRPPAGGTEGGLFVYNNSGDLILDPTHGIFPGAVTLMPLQFFGALGNVGHAGVTFLTETVTLTGRGTQITVGCGTSLLLEDSGKTQTIDILITVDGTVVAWSRQNTGQQITLTTFVGPGVNGDPGEHTIVFSANTDTAGHGGITVNGGFMGIVDFKA